MLLAVLEGLLEQAAVVGQAYSVRGKSQCRKAVDKAGRESSKAAVSEGGLIFEFLQLSDIFAGLSQFRLHIVVDAEVDQVVGKELADQKFCRNIVNFLLSAVVSSVSTSLLRQGQRCVVELQDRTILQRFPCIIFEVFHVFHTFFFN